MEPFGSADSGMPAGRKTLVVVVHGLGGSAHRMRDVIAAARAAYDPGSVVYAPDLPHARWLSGARAGSIIETLLDGIDAQVASHAPDRIVLVGHSGGATLAPASPAEPPRPPEPSSLVLDSPVRSGQSVPPPAGAAPRIFNSNPSTHPMVRPR